MHSAASRGGQEQSVAQQDSQLLPSPITATLFLEATSCAHKQPPATDRSSPCQVGG